MENRLNFAKGNLRYKTGNAVIPVSAGHRLIVHICNDAGMFGAGFSGALQKRWQKVHDEYKRWYRGQRNFKLGMIQTIHVQSDTAVINMLAQKGVKKASSKKDIVDYDALEQCLSKVITIAKEFDSSVHMPRIGMGFAGAKKWSKIEDIIKKTLIENNINVTVYDLPE